jgi:fatty acid desaturase
VADADDRVRAATAAVLTLVGAIGLGLVGRGLYRRRRWARAPALVTNLLVLPVAFDLTRGGRWYVGVPLLLLAVVVLVLLFVRPTDEALQED